MESPEDDTVTTRYNLSSLPSSYFEEDTEYEMLYTGGAHMWDFWLSESKYAKSLEWWKSRITSKVLSFELKEALSVSKDELVILLLPSRIAIRALLLSDTKKDMFGNYNAMILDIDTGEMMRIYVDTLYIPDEEVIKKKPFAVNCCLNVGYSKYSKLFCQNISGRCLKVSFKRVTLSTPPKYVVSIKVKKRDEYVDIIDTLNSGIKSPEIDASTSSPTALTESYSYKFEGFHYGKSDENEGTRIVMDVHVSHIESLSQFYIWESMDDLKQLKKLIAEMNEFYKSTNLEAPDNFYDNLSGGSVCAVLDVKDVSWYRGKILNHSKTTDFKGLVQKHYEILMVDFGSKIEVPCSLLKPLNPDFIKSPVFAKRCHLFGIKPAPDLQGPNGIDYSQDIIEIFEMFLESGKLTLIEAPTSPNDPENSTPVILERNYKGNDYVINLELLAQKLVTSSVLDVNVCTKIFECAENEKIDPPVSDVVHEAVEEVPEPNPKVEDKEVLGDKILSLLRESSPSQDPGESFSDWNPMEEDYSKNDITYENMITDDASALIGYQARDEERICKFFAESGHCYKGAGCRKEHKSLRPDGVTTDQMAVPGKTYCYLALPKEGSEVKLHVMFVSDVCKFYGVLVDAWKYKETQCEFLPNEKCEEDTLDNLIDLINSKENVSKLRRLVMPPGVGEIVLCKMHSVNLFYRAQVIDTNIEDSEFEVLFVDVGITEWALAKNIRQVENEYLHLPFQAIECELANFGASEDADGQRRLQIMRKLSSMISFRILKTRVVRSFTPINKLIVELFDESGANIGEVLRDAGYLVEVGDIYKHCGEGPLPG